MDIMQQVIMDQSVTMTGGAKSFKICGMGHLSTPFTNPATSGILT